MEPQRLERRLLTVLLSAQPAEGDIVLGVRAGGRGARNYRVDRIEGERITGTEVWFEEGPAERCKYSEKPVELDEVRAIRPGTAPQAGVPLRDQSLGTYRPASR